MFHPTSHNFAIPYLDQALPPLSRKYESKIDRRTKARQLQKAQQEAEAKKRAEMLRLQNKRQAEKSKVESQAAKKPTPQAPSIAQIAAGQEPVVQLAFQVILAKDSSTEKGYFAITV